MNDVYITWPKGYLPERDRWIPIGAKTALARPGTLVRTQAGNRVYCLVRPIDKDYVNDKGYDVLIGMWICNIIFDSSGNSGYDHEGETYVEGFILVDPVWLGLLHLKLMDLIADCKKEWNGAMPEVSLMTRKENDSV